MDAMVTARMPQGKKEVGNSILKELGTNPSQFINDVYDFIIKNRCLPFQDEQSQRTQDELEEACLFITSIPMLTPSRFASMTDDEIKQERLIARKLATKNDFA